MSIPLVTNPVYSFTFPASHRFPMEKFALLRELADARGWLGPNNVFRPGRAKQSVLELAHCPGYLQRFSHNQQTRAELRRMGLPWSEGLVKRTLISPNGTLLAANLALQHGIACHLAGGTHHAHYDFASGFCILNDLAVAAKALLASGRVQQILIFDCDVHQGDGTARILAHEPRAFTCSIHCAKNFPARKAESDWDVDLPVGIEDQAYLEVVEETLYQAVIRCAPDMILYDAGVDVFGNDPLGLINVSFAGIRARERLVLEFCRAQGIPVATVIGGGYDDDRRALTERHALVVEAAFDTFGKQ